MIYYVSKNVYEYSSGIYSVISAILPHENLTQSGLESIYDIVISTDTLDDSIAGYPDKFQ